MRLLGPAGFEGGVGRMVFLDLQRQWAVGKYNKHPVRRKPGRAPPAYYNYRVVIVCVCLAKRWRSGGGGLFKTCESVRVGSGLLQLAEESMPPSVELNNDSLFR